MTKKETINKIRNLLSVLEQFPEDVEIINSSVNHINGSSVFLFSGIERINKPLYEIHDYTKESICIGTGIDDVDVHQLYSREEFYELLT